jgi:hypothetical protein
MCEFRDPLKPPGLSCQQLLLVCHMKQQRILRVRNHSMCSNVVISLLYKVPDLRYSSNRPVENSRRRILPMNVCEHRSCQAISVICVTKCDYDRYEWITVVVNHIFFFSRPLLPTPVSRFSVEVCNFF